mmetsp:Transcript_18849/g.41996  ORF Transcript_18849/g.41996 Transcript_18849/m.41996 type:complete len:127 (+) Transcript_18849:153-533(+)
MNQSIFFEDIFEVNMLNEYGKKFERVNRLHCKGTTFDVDFVVDVNSELFDAKAGDRVGVVLARYAEGYLESRPRCLAFHTLTRSTHITRLQFAEWGGRRWHLQAHLRAPLPCRQLRVCYAWQSFQH